MWFPKFNANCTAGVLCAMLSLCWVEALSVSKQTSLYACDFNDDDNCDGTMSNSTFSKLIKNIRTLPIESDGYTITDFSSINEPTGNGWQCNIPFEGSDGKQYYHCDKDFTCKTDNGQDTCSEGRFLGGSFNNRSIDRFIVNNQNVTTQAVYELKYRYFIYCPSTLCGLAEDFIQVTLSQTDANGKTIEQSFTETYQINGGDKRWTESKNLINLEAGDFSITIIFRRLVKNNNTAYFGFDSVSIIEPEEPVNISVPTTPKPLTNLTQKELIYACNFDLFGTDNCKGVQIEANSFDVTAVKQSAIREPTSIYYISDVTSITKPTKKNNTCRIPFYQNNVEYYHCDRRLSCQTIQTNLKEFCQDGLFLSSKVTSKTTNQQSSIKFPVIPIESEAQYALDFYALMYCENLNNTACQKKTDQIVLRYENNNNVGYLKFSGKQKRWNQQRLNVILEEGNLAITILLNRNRESRESTIHYGIDELSVYKLANVTYDTTVFECNFDSDDCGIQVEHDMEDFKQNIVEKSIINQTYPITDISSITKPTNQGYNCKIPFFYLQVEYNHCTLLHKCVTRETDKLDDCAKGKFLNAKIDSPFESQSTTATFRTMNLTADGQYKIEFYLFMYCDRLSLSQEQCQSKINDQIVIMWQNNNELKEIRKYFKVSRAWIKQSYIVQLKEGTLDFSVSFNRPNEFETEIVQFGFDNLKISKANEEELELVKSLNFE